MSNNNDRRRSEIGIGMQREAGSILFRLIGIVVILAVSLVGCAILTGG